MPDKMTTLGDLLNADQLSVVESILNKDTNETEKVIELKKYLQQHRTELEAKGLVPEYLAYVIVYHPYGGRNGHTEVIGFDLN